MTSLETPQLGRYIEDRLLHAKATSFTDENGNTQYIATEDGNARCSPSHTLDWTTKTFSNTNHTSSGDDPIGSALVRFYENSLAAKEPMTANTIICHERLIVPFPFLKRIHWEHNSWLIFNDKTGLLTDKWWHIYGHFTS